MVARAFLIFLFTLGLLIPSARAQTNAPPKPLRVAVAGMAPFITQNNGTPDGFSIDVWEELAAKNEWSFAYTSYPKIEDGLKAVSSGQADVLVGDISIISSLFSTVEFSQPYYRAGLQIMVPEARPYTAKRLFEDLYAWAHLKILWISLIVIAIASVLVMLFERRHNKDFPKGWADGFAESLYYVISLSLGKPGYKGFGGWLGRLVMIVWTVLGVVAVIYVTSRVTAAMTTEAFNSYITGPESLPGKTVGVVTGSLAIDYLKQHSITYNEYPDLDTAVQKMLKGDVPALVGAAPILQTYDKDHPTLSITEIGRIFDYYNYGFAMPIGSELRAPLNRALLDLQENGILLKIGTSYFGSVYHP